MRISPVLDTGNPMKRIQVLTPLAMTLSLGLAGLTGCGTGSSSTITPPPSITSFTSNPTSITDGSNAL